MPRFCKIRHRTRFNDGIRRRCLANTTLLLPPFVGLGPLTGRVPSDLTPSEGGSRNLLKLKLESLRIQYRRKYEVV